MAWEKQEEEEEEDHLKGRKGQETVKMKRRIPADGIIKIPVLDYADTERGPFTAKIEMGTQELDVGDLVATFGAGVLDEIGEIVRDNNKPEAMTSRWQAKKKAGELENWKGQ